MRRVVLLGLGALIRETAVCMVICCIKRGSASSCQIASAYEAYFSHEIYQRTISVFMKNQFNQNCIIAAGHESTSSCRMNCAARILRNIHQGDLRVSKTCLLHLFPVLLPLPYSTQLVVSIIANWNTQTLFYDVCIYKKN